MRLIACGAKKLDHAARAKDIYTGSLFRLARAWAVQSPDGEWGILSAKYGLLHPDDTITPYNKTWSKAPDEWVGRVLERMPIVDVYEFAAPKRYCERLLPKLENSVNVLSGCKGMGYQAQWLKRNTR